MRQSVLCAIGCAALPWVLPAQEGPGLFKCARFPLVLDLSKLPELKVGTATEHTPGVWYGKVAGCEWEVRLTLYPHEKYGLWEPSMALAFVDDWYRGQQQAEAGKGVLGATRVLHTRCGFAPYGCVASGFVKHWGAWVHVMTGVAEDSAYGIEVTVKGEGAERVGDRVSGFFESGVRYEGGQWDPGWTDAELQARWKRDAPASLAKERFRVLRTDHYVILSNASAAQAFAKAMEACYKRIKQVYPFDEPAGMRLMPVYVFRLPEEYHAFYTAKFKASLAEAKETQGIASADFYATWYEAPKDPVHIHEATHQIFDNRLFLSGGGSWFQEGVAEYVAEHKNVVKAVARRASRDGTLPKLQNFVRIESLIAAADGARYYTLAASLIACVRESRWGKKKFLEFVRAIGGCPDNDVEAIEAAVQRIYGFGLDELHRRWAKHFG